MTNEEFYTALALCDLAADYAEKPTPDRPRYVEIRKGYMTDVNKSLRGISFRQVAYHTERLKHYICDDFKGKDVDLNGDGNCRLAAEIIINKLGNYELLSEALEEAEILRAKAKA